MLGFKVKYIVGYNIPHASRFQDIIYELLQNRHLFSWPEFALGMLWIAMLVGIKTAPRIHRYAGDFVYSNEHI